MNYFNVNAYYLGMLVFACVYFSNIVYSLICFIWKIKIVEFTIFANAWFSLYKESVLGVKFILGWFPMSSYIKPLGMNATEEEKLEFSENDLPYTFFNKPKYLKTIFQIIPWIIDLAILFAAIFFLSNSSVISEISKIAIYVVDACKMMFSENVEKTQFISKTQEILKGKNVVVYTFALLILLFQFFKPITAIISWFSIDNNNKTKFQKILGFLSTILMLWLLLWKIPKFIFSFFTIQQILIYISSYLVGMFSIGLLLFFSTLFVVKNIDLNLSKYRS